MCQKAASQKFEDLGEPNRIWAIPSIHGCAESLIHLHDLIYEQFELGDKILYLGNYTGYGTQNIEVIDEILTFRRMIMSLPGVFPDDLVYLRGRQEVMISKLLQLQFAPDPRNVLDWMLKNGMQSTMDSYEVDIDRGLRAALEGVTGIGCWTRQVGEKLKSYPGHDVFRNQLRRAAFTNMNFESPLLFVHAGLAPDKALSIQGDHLWWSGHDFNKITKPYSPFRRVIRGYDPYHRGVHVNGVTATLDNGAGMGGDLVVGCIDRYGQHIDVMSA